MGLIIAVIVAFAVLYAQQKYFKTHWNRGLEVQLRFQKKGVSAGEKCYLEETVVNEKRMPLSSLQVKFTASNTFLFEQEGNAAVTDQYYRTDLFAVGGRLSLIHISEPTRP